MPSNSDNIDNQEAVKLEACPFCGSTKLLKTGAYSPYVECRTCGAQGPCDDDYPNAPLDRWNTRTPAKLDAPDNQEALAGEGVERRARELLAAELERNDQFASAGEVRRAPALDFVVPTAVALRAIAKALPSNEALAGDDRNGVEGPFSWETRADHGDDSIHHMIDHEDGDLVGEAATPEWAEQIANALNAAALSRTPSSPQADVADVERDAETAALVALAEHGDTTDLQELLVRGSRTLSPGALTKMVRAVRSTMTTRPAGVESSQPFTNSDFNADEEFIGTPEEFARRTRPAGVEEVATSADDEETRAFIAGWNASRGEHRDDFDMALHWWKRAQCGIGEGLATLASPAPQAEAVEGLLPMETAPKDGRYILAVYQTLGGEGYGAHLDGRVFVARHEGATVSDYDLGWALFPGFGGVPDKCLAGWAPLPPQIAAALSTSPSPPGRAWLVSPEEQQRALLFALGLVTNHANEAMHVRKSSRDVVEGIEAVERTLKAMIEALATPPGGEKLVEAVAKAIRTADFEETCKFPPRTEWDREHDHTLNYYRAIARGALAALKPSALPKEHVPCPRCDDSGYAETASGGIWTGEGIVTRHEVCDCPGGDDVRRERALPKEGEEAILTDAYKAMTPLEKWETLVLNGLIGTDEPWIEDMRQSLATLSTNDAIRAGVVEEAATGEGEA